MRKEEEERLQDIENAERMLRIEAWTVAKNFVKDELALPRTADFGWQQDADDNVTKARTGLYRVSGWVECENSLGGTVRHDFTCVVKRTGEKLWECESLNLE